jgi:hypothetical protein
LELKQTVAAGPFERDLCPVRVAIPELRAGGGAARPAGDFGDTKEAGLISVRVASSMEGKREQGLIENAFGGRREPETWGKPSPWCHYSGPVGVEG